MELLYILGWGFAIIAPVVLFFMNNRQAERLDRLENENKVQFSNLARLEQLYTALLASRHQPGTLAAASVLPVTPPSSPVTPVAVPVVPADPVAPTPVLAAPVSPPSPPAAAPLAPEPPPAPVPRVPAAAPPRPIEYKAATAVAAPAVAVLASSKRQFSWERFLGVQLPIWLGAIALSLAGFFFVRYVIDADLFTPLFRIVIGVLAAIAILGVAEFVRRTSLTNASQIASALAAASIATLYACAYYASVGFGLIAEWAGFAAMALVTLFAIGIAQRFGRIVAMVGLIGGYVTPAFFSSDDPSAFVLFGYLTVVLAGIFFIVRARDWWVISLPALLGPLIWMMVWAGVGASDTEAWWVGVFAIAVPLVVLVAASDSWLSEDAPLKLGDERGRPATPGAAIFGAFGSSGLGLFVLLAQANVTAPYWVGLGALALLAVALGFLRPMRLGWLQFLALGATVLACLAWRDPSDGAAWLIGAVALILAAGAADQFRRLHRPLTWAAALTFVAVFFFGFGMFRIAGWDAVVANKHLWAFGALFLAAAMMALLWFFGRSIEGEIARNRVYAVLGGGASAFLSLLVVIELDAGYFPLGAALMVLGLSYIHYRAPLRGLQAVTAIYLGLYVILIVGNPLLRLEYASWSTAMMVPSLSDANFVQLVLPGLVLIGAATLFHWSRALTLAGFLDVIGLAAVGWGVLFAVVPNLEEEMLVGGYVLAARILNPQLLLAALAIAAGRFLGRQALYVAGMVLAGLMALGVLAGSVLPVYTFWPWLELPGWGLLNVAVLALGTPAMVLLGIGWFLRQDAHRPVANYGRVLSVFGVFALFTLMLVEIRHGFHPDGLQGPTSEVEFYSYSVGMLAFGVALLVIGVAIQNRGARMLSFVFVLGAVVKVFLWDTAGLDGLWRVMSFFGMGLCLLAISWLYARFVFGLEMGRKAEPLVAAPASPPAQ